MVLNGGFACPGSLGGQGADIQEGGDIPMARTKDFDGATRDESGIRGKGKSRKERETSFSLFFLFPSFFFSSFSLCS